MMGVVELASHIEHVATPGFGALIAAWLAWRIWRRLVRAAIACVVVGLVVYFAFPDVAHQLVQEERTHLTSTTGDR